jgi:putative copper export protein
MLVAAFLAASAVVFVSVAGGTWPYAALGNTDPGTLVRVGAPVLRLVADSSAAVTIGSLACAAFFAAAGQDRLTRTAGRAATVWAIAAGTLIPFDVADQTGQSLAGPPVGAVSSASATTWQLWSALETPIAWLVTAWLALGIAIACRMLTGRRPLVAVLCAALLATLPVVATGHASAEIGHDIATGALLVHVPLALLWLGVLVALTRVGWRTGLPMEELARRYRRLAGWCWLGLGGSGLVVGWMLGSAGAYGLLLLIKVVVLGGLGLSELTVAIRAARSRT